MNQRHDPREHHRSQNAGSDFRDYDDFQRNDNFEDPSHPQYRQYYDRSQRPQPQQQEEPQRRFRYTGSATTNAARRYQDQWSPNWVTRGGAPEYRRNSSGQGEMYGLRQESSWDTDYNDTQDFDHQDERPQFRNSRSNSGSYNGYSQNQQANQWRAPGEFYGKGPKGYTRADLRMEEDVNEQLTRHPYLDATDIEVKVKDGIATLTGTVRTKECKRTAEDLAEDVSGIKEVQNQLRVVPSTLISSSNQQPNRPPSGSDRSRTH